MRKRRSKKAHCGAHYEAGKSPESPFDSGLYDVLRRLGAIAVRLSQTNTTATAQPAAASRHLSAQPTASEGSTATFYSETSYLARVTHDYEAPRPTQAQRTAIF